MSTIDLITPPSEVELIRGSEEHGVEFDGTNWVEKTVSNFAAAAGMTIGSKLLVAAEPTKAGRVFGSEMCFRCYPEMPSKYRKPDVSFVAAGRLPANWRELAMMPVPADLAVEVVSPNDFHYDVEEKLDEYLNAGFGTVWIVNPIRKTVVVHRAGQQPMLLRADDEITGEPFLSTFRCKVSALFE